MNAFLIKIRRVDPGHIISNNAKRSSMHRGVVETNSNTLGYLATYLRVCQDASAASFDVNTAVGEVATQITASGNP